eukprot:gene47118-4310_t
MRWRVRLPSRAELAKKSADAVEKLAESVGLLQKGERVPDAQLRARLEELRGAREPRTLHSRATGQWCIGGGEADIRAGGAGWACSVATHHFAAPHRAGAWAQAAGQAADRRIRIEWVDDDSADAAAGDEHGDDAARKRSMSDNPRSLSDNPRSMSDNDLLAWVEERRSGSWDGQGEPVEFYDFPEERGMTSNAGTTPLDLIRFENDRRKGC